MNEEPQEIGERAFAFAVRVVKLCQVLDEKPGALRTLANQLLRSGTSIGANLAESRCGQSRAEYFEIVMRRHEVRSTIMTSNRPLEEWGKLVGDIPAATAILDRFMQHAEIIQITGKSYRMKDRIAGQSSKSEG